MSMVNGLYEQNIFTENYPFKLFLNDSENFVFPLHWHHAIELIYPIDNSYTATVNDQEYIMNQKDILFIAGGDTHSFNTSNNAGNRYFIQFDIFTLDVFGKYYNFNPSLLMTQLIAPENNSLLHQKLETQIIEIINEYEQKPFAYDLTINARVFDILVLLFRNIPGNYIFASSNNCSKRIHSMERLNYAFQYIEENYQKNVTLKDASEAAGFSEHHFSRLFKEMTGQNFNCYVTSRRIKKAEKLLINHDLSIIEIAHAAGFNSIGTFNRIFKKSKSCTPMEYRKLQLHTRNTWGSLNKYNLAPLDTCNKEGATSNE